MVNVSTQRVGVQLEQAITSAPLLILKLSNLGIEIIQTMALLFHSSFDRSRVVESRQGPCMYSKIEKLDVNGVFFLLPVRRAALLDDINA